MSYQLSQRISFSILYERFSGIYQDEESLLREDLILYRSGKNYGVNLSYRWLLNERLSLIPYLGILGRQGFEVYEFYPEITGQLRTIELNDIGVTPGLSINYKLGKGFSIFTLVDYTRFVRTKSAPLGERDFYDGPTLNYIRTRLGIQYSLSHLVKAQE